MKESHGKGVANRVLSQNPNPDVSMMESAEDWYRCDAADLLRAPKIGQILFQSEMRADLVVIRREILQNATQLRSSNTIR
jgi:hypothetical protein